ncbi:MAG TPA: S53 family peptidase [Kofleriaceae bacterium]|nr:S53 family peptidase [Kofleriaceae bacterium]
MLFASCASADREDTVGDRQVDELGAIPQQPESGVCAGGVFRCKSHIRTDESNHIKPFATPQGFGPADLQAAYKLTGGTANGTVSIVDAYNYPNAESDLASYRSQFGLPACTVASGCLTIDKSQNPGTAPSGDDWTVEAALDLDMVSAACPSCKIKLVLAKDDQGTGLFTAQAQAASTGVLAISNSWGGPSDGNDLTYDTQYFTHAGVNIFIATGDNGNTGTSPDYPSTSPKVIGVGGTSLTKSTSAARGWTEGAWSGAGSSCSKLETKPSYQSVVPAAACAKRAASDVSAVADPNTGLAVFNAGSGGWIVVGGTSAASPFVAGVFARYGLATTNDGSFPYSNPTFWFDVTTGSNGSCSSALCKAGSGWDGPTGLGTPNGTVISGGGGGGCTPSCSGKTCGSDGCGGTCGTCASGQTCSPAGTCTGGGSCDHPICSTGDALTASCDPCAAEICSADSFCCASSWDSICVGEVSSVCHQSCGGTGTCTHSECTTGAKLKKGCDTCVTSICAQDSFCCATQWDSQCVSETSSICHETCN